MASPTDQQLLDAVNNAINSILVSGTAYSINGRTKTSADLKDLWLTKLNLEQRVNSATVDPTGTGIALVTFNGPV